MQYKFIFWLNWWFLTSIASSFALASLQYGGSDLISILVKIEIWSVLMAILQARLLDNYNSSRGWIAAATFAPLLSTPTFIVLAGIGLLGCCYQHSNPIIYTFTLSYTAFISGCIFALIQAYFSLWHFSGKVWWIVCNGLGFALLIQIAAPSENAISVFGSLSNFAWCFSSLGFGAIQATSMVWLLQSEINNH